MVFFALILAGAALGWLYILCRILSRISEGDKHIIRLAIVGHAVVAVWPIVYLYILWRYYPYVAASWWRMSFHTIWDNAPVFFLFLATGWFYLFFEAVRRPCMRRRVAMRVQPYLRDAEVTYHCVPPLRPQRSSVKHLLRTVSRRIPGNHLDTLHINHYTLTLPARHMPDAPVRIAHLTDMHMTPDMPEEYYTMMANHVRDLSPDIIVLTGDFTCDEKSVPRIPAVFKHVSAPHGVYFVLGNHDIWHADTQVRKQLINCGFTHLADRSLRIDLPGAPLYLCGTERPFHQEKHIDTFIHALPKDAFSLAISHHPDSVRWLADAQIACVLCGHTHGGQNALPLIGPPLIPSAYGEAYAHGFITYKNTIMYVNQGVAAHAVARFLCPLEIACFDFQPY